jgi:pimeloyl-ACP methyl ester carboxylesterase
MDIRGFGKSFRPPNKSDYHFSRMVEDIYKIIKKEKINEIILIGNSFGNFLAFEFIKKHPSLIKKVIFISPLDNPSSVPLTKYTKGIAKFVCKISPLFKKNVIGKHFDYYEWFKDRHTGDWDIKRLYPEIKNTGLRSGLASFSYIFNYKAPNIIYKLNFPVLIIHGKKDTVFPLKYIKIMSEKMKNTKLTIINNGDHILLVNNLKELIPIISKFINSK